MNPFYQDVYELVAKVPYGKVVSYSQISWYLGELNQARAVGRAMKYSPDHLPAHRVVRADGVLVGPSAEMRRAALAAEGVLFKSNGNVNMKACSWQIPVDACKERP